MERRDTVEARIAAQAAAVASAARRAIRLTPGNSSSPASSIQSSPRGSGVKVQQPSTFGRIHKSSSASASSSSSSQAGPYSSQLSNSLFSAVPATDLQTTPSLATMRSVRALETQQSSSARSGSTPNSPRVVSSEFLIGDEEGMTNTPLDVLTEALRKRKSQLDRLRALLRTKIEEGITEMKVSTSSRVVADRIGVALSDVLKVTEGAIADIKVVFPDDVYASVLDDETVTSSSPKGDGAVNNSSQTATKTEDSENSASGHPTLKHAVSLSHMHYSTPPTLENDETWSKTVTERYSRFRTLARSLRQTALLTQQVDDEQALAGYELQLAAAAVATRNAETIASMEQARAAAAEEQEKKLHERLVESERSRARIAAAAAAAIEVDRAKIDAEKKLAAAEFAALLSSAESTYLKSKEELEAKHAAEFKEINEKHALEIEKYEMLMAGVRSESSNLRADLAASKEETELEKREQVRLKDLITAVEAESGRRVASAMATLEFERMRAETAIAANAAAAVEHATALEKAKKAVDEAAAEALEKIKLTDLALADAADAARIAASEQAAASAQALSSLVDAHAQALAKQLAVHEAALLEAEERRKADAAANVLALKAADERRIEERSELQQSLIEAVENTEKIRLETNAILADREAKSVAEADKLRAECNASLVKKDAECASAISAVNASCQEAIHASEVKRIAERADLQEKLLESIESAKKRDAASKKDLDEALLKLKVEVQLHKEEMDKLKSQHSAAIESAVADLKAELQSLQEKSASESAQAAQREKELIEKHETTLAEQKTADEETLRLAKVSSDAEISKHVETIQNMTTEHAAALSALKASHEEEFSSFKALKEEEVIRLRDESSTALLVAMEAYKKEVNDLTEKHKEELNNLLSESAAAAKNAAETAQAKADEFARILKDQSDRAAADLREVSELRDIVQARLDEKTRLQKEGMDANKELLDVRMKETATVASLQAALEAKDAEHQAAIAKLQEESNAAIDAIKFEMAVAAERSARELAEAKNASVAASARAALESASSTASALTMQFEEKERELKEKVAALEKLLADSI